ncbi:efflux RND transporter permease subunit [uncultured Sulfitobacter sp.]|uniref:efflux RND transporter permease subunit n=1 Tax=uncultured Sulfitobacter sp. TaxID=191468 RepID=UPI002610EFC5|nr:efflux RND transporter permease subunit [uncultured Sulfitobacter sp.]
MGGIIRWFLRNPVAANLLMALMVAAGIAALFSVTVRTFPEIATGAVTVTVPYPGATPTEVSDAVLVPIEERLQGLEGIRKLTGTARSGVGTVTADLVRGAVMADVKDDIETEIARITTFPAASDTPRIAEVEPVELAVQIVIHGDAPPETLKALGEQARRELRALPDVSQVAISGAATDLIEIEVTRETLRSYGIGLAELAQRLSAETLDLSGGVIDDGNRDIQVRTVGEASSADQLRGKILFTGASGAEVRLSDIARIRETLADEDISASVGRKPAVFVSVNRVGSEQVLATADAARTWLEEEFRPQLPEQITATVWRNEAETLRGRISLLIKNAAIGTALVLTVLTLFVDLRIALWVALGVAVSFIGAFGPMLVFGTTINQLSLFGFILALGIVVDDAIVVGENTFVELEGDGDAAGAAERAVMRVWRPIAFSVTTSIAAFVPLLFLPGSSGSFIAPVAAVVIYLLSLSLAESFFVLPRHLSSIRLSKLRRYSPRRATEWLRTRVDGWFRRTSDRRLRPVVRGAVVHPVFTLVTCLAIGAFAAGLIGGGTVKFVFFPAIEGNFVTAQLNLPEGTTSEETAAKAEQFIAAAERAAEDLGESDLLEATAVTVGFGTGGGGPSAATAPAGSTATIEARLRDAATRETDAETFKNAWREAVGEVAGASEVIFSSSVVGVGAAIQLQVSAETEAARDAALGEMRSKLEERDGVFDIRDDRVSAAREVTIDLRPAARVYGISLQTVANEVRAAFYGAVVDQIARNREEVDLRLRLAGPQRDSIADLLLLDIPTPEGGMVALPIVADIGFQSAPTEITRINGRAIATLTADADTAVTTGGTETSWLLSQVVPKLQQDYPTLTVTAGGEQEEAGRFGPALAFNFALALFVIYALLALAFGSYSRPLIVLGVIPFGVVGAVFGHALLGLNLTLLSMFGIVGLAGVIVNGALLIVDFIIAREDDGDDPMEAITEATLSRFRPVMLTTLTTFLGISPLILETSVQAQFLVPTAVSLGFGILFVSVMQMVLVPAYASFFARGRKRLRAKN